MNGHDDFSLRIIRWVVFVNERFLIVPSMRKDVVVYLEQSVVDELMLN